MAEKAGKSAPPATRLTVMVAGTSIILLILHLLPSFFPEGRFWGFNHFLFIPGGLAAALFLTAALALVGSFMPEASARGERWAAIFNDLFFISSFRYVNRAAVTAVIVFFFLIFNRPTHFLGDGYGYLEIFNRGLADFESGGRGATLLISWLQKIIGGENSALAAFRMLSIISGVIYIWLLFAVAGATISSPVKKILIIASGLFSGVILLFFGYVEFYPCLWPIFLSVFYFALKSPFEGKNLAWAWGLTALGIFYHIQIVILIPAVIYMTFSQGAGWHIYRRFRLFVWFFILAAFVVLTAMILTRIRNDIAFENLFLPLFSGKPIDPDYAVFSLKHLADIFNQLMLVIPLLFLLLPFLISERGSGAASQSGVFLSLSSLAGLVFVLFVDPQLGMPRDWDLFALPLWPLILTAVFYLGYDTRKILNRFLPVLIVFPAVFTLPFLITNLSGKPSIRYAEYATSLDQARTFGAFAVLKEMAEKERDLKRADSLNAVYEKNYPVARYNQIMKKLDENQFEEAMRLFATVPANRFDGDWQRIRGRYYYLRGEFAKGLEHMNHAIKLRPYQAEYYWQRGMIYFSWGKTDSSLADLRRAYRRDSNSLRILDALAYMFSEAGQLDSTIYYGEKLVGLDSSAMGGYYLLAKAYAGQRLPDKAISYARRFLHLTEKETAYDSQRREMELLAGRTSSGEIPQ